VWWNCFLLWVRDPVLLWYCAQLDAGVISASLFEYWRTPRANLHCISPLHPDAVFLWLSDQRDWCHPTLRAAHARACGLAANNAKQRHEKWSSRHYFFSGQICQLVCLWKTEGPINKIFSSTRPHEVVKNCTGGRHAKKKTGMMLPAALHLILGWGIPQQAG